MAVTPFGYFTYPGFVPTGSNRAIAFSTLVLDAAGEKAALMFPAPKAGVISHLHFRSNTVTTPGDADVRLETVDGTTGDPTGTLQGTNTNGAQTIATSNTWHRTALSAGATVAQGDPLALVIANSSGNYQITQMDTTVFGRAYPFTSFFTASWAKTGGALNALVEYNDASFGFLPGVWPVLTLTNLAHSTSTSPDEFGNRFTAPAALQVVGAGFYGDLDQAAELHLYNASDVSIASVTTAMDPQVRSGGVAGMNEYYFGTTVTLTAGDVYRLIVKPTSTTSQTWQVFNFQDAAYLAAVPGGADMHYTSRSDAGAFAETTTRRANLWLIVSGIDLGSAGAVGAGNMRGGLQ